MQPIELTQAKNQEKVHIACDFDGVLAQYESWEKNGDKVSKPVRLMVSRVKDWLSKGYKVSIFTSRLSHGYTESEKQISLIQEFLKENGLPEDLQITCIKMSYFTHFFDDRAYNVVKNQGIVENSPI